MNIIDLADHIIIGGGMAFTFLKVLHGIEIGKSLFDKEGAKIIHDIMAKASARGVQVHLPVDYVCADLSLPVQERVCTISDNRSGIAAGLMGLDIGPDTTSNYEAVLRQAKTVIWNGPMGMCEQPAFA